MSLRSYCRERLLVLNADSPVVEAARAIEQNRVGAVVVSDRGRVAGIVTDRDLVIRVLGRGLDPQTTRIGEVMTAPVATLTPFDTPAAAVGLMREHNVRRIPLVEGERVVGMVTLDDLLLDEAAAVEDVAAIVQGQIGEGGPAVSERTPAGRRRSARALTTLGRLLRQVQVRAGFENTKQAEAALRVVLSALVRRLSPQEAKHFIAQLPSLLQPPLRRLAVGKVERDVTRPAIEGDLSRMLRIDAAQASKTLLAVGSVIAENVSEGEMEDVRGQLPQELRDVFTSAAVPA